MKNITFTELTIQNFLSVGKPITIPFQEGINIITGKNKDKEDGNGVGKSTICDAFYFALFGETLRDLNKENIVNNIAKKNCQVNLTLEVDKNGVVTKYRIERGLSPSFCRIYVDNGRDDKALSTIPATNIFILNLINSTQPVFRNTITTGINNSKPFMGQKKNEKREFVEGILRLEIFKAMTKVAKENYDGFFRNYETSLKLLQECESNIKLYEVRKIDHDTAVATSIADMERKKESKRLDIEAIQKVMLPVDKSALQKLTIKETNLTTLLKEITTTHNTLVTKMGNLNGRKSANDKQIILVGNLLSKLTQDMANCASFAPNVKTVEESNVIINTEKSKIEKYKTQNTEYTYQNRDLEKENATLFSIGNTCDKCKRPYPQQDVASNAIKIEDNIKIIEQNTRTISDNTSNITKSNQLIQVSEIFIKILEYSKQKYTLEDENKIIISELEKFHSELVTTENMLIQTNSEVKILQEQKTNIKMAIQTYNFGLERIKNYETEIKHFEDVIIIQKNVENPFDAMIRDTLIKKKDLTTTIDGLKEKMAVYDVIKHVVSDDGIKSFIIKKLLGVLNERVNYYLGKMDANCTLTFDEYFDATIINDRGIECDYNNFSGGERKRIDLAALFAFCDIRRLQGDVTFNLAFYDELLDSAISVECSEKVIDILKERLVNYKESSYIITHKTENLKNPNISGIIYLEKSGGITKLRENKNDN